MKVYIVLLILIITISIYINGLRGNRKIKKEYFLNIAFFLIFLLYSLRSSSVGRDLSGYERLYLITSTRDWTDYSYVYFEEGYIFLMKICNLIGLSFQEFLVIVNFMILIPIYVFIKKYSKHYFLSVIMYICYIFFEFNLTGIRQAIASSIILLGIMTLLDQKKYRLLKYMIIVYFATLFHKGAFIGFYYVPFYFIKKQKNYISLILAISTTFILGREKILYFIKEFFGRSTDTIAKMYIGFNFVFLIGLAVLIVVGEINREKTWSKFFIKNKDIKEKIRFVFKIEQKEKLINNTLNKMFLLSLSLILLFGLDSTARSYMFFSQVILVQFPNSIEFLFKKNTVEIKLIITMGITVFFIVFFYISVLKNGNLDIVPYRFYWE